MAACFVWFLLVFFFKQKTAYEISACLVGSVTEFCDYTVMVKGTVLASGPTDITFTAENLERAFSGVLRHVVLSGSEDRIITDDERPFVTHRQEAK